MLDNHPIPVLGFVAFSGTGKTTLLTQVIQQLSNNHGIRLAVIKHAHHQFDIDIPGKDSYELRHSGAQQTLVTSSRRWALMHERISESDPTLNEALTALSTDTLDLVLVEGFKHEPFPKIELYRAAVSERLLCLEDTQIIALATDDVAIDAPCTILDINKVSEVCAFIFSFMETHHVTE